MPKSIQQLFYKAAMALTTILGLNGTLWASEIPSEDQNFGCLAEAEARTFIRDFNIDFRSFGGLELCNSQVDTKKLFNDLQIVKEGQFKSEKRDNKLIRNFVPEESYYAWLKEQTRGIERGNDIPYATAYNTGGFFTMQNGWAQLSTLGRVGTLVHEARHTTGYSHRRCVFGPYARTSVPGCDRNFAEGGSHGVEMEYYARVSVRGTNFHPVYKTMARLMAMGRTNFVFNESPIVKRTGLLIYNQESGSYVIENDQAYLRSYPSRTGLLKRTSFGASMFDGVKSFALEIYQNLNEPSLISDDYSYHKLLHEERGQGASSLTDIEEVDSAESRHLFVLNKANQYTSYDFGSGKFRPYRNTLPEAGRFATYDSQGTEGLYFIGNSNRVWKMNFSALQFQETGAQFDSNTESMFQYNKDTYALTKNREVYRKINGAFEKTSKFDSWLTDSSQLTTVPLYDAFEVR